MLRETEIALANLDWLIHHLDARLDYQANAVFIGVTDAPEFVVSDLCTPGLTPATDPNTGPHEFFQLIEE